MDRTRIDRRQSDSDPLPPPALDRAWAATRPPELSADAFDRIWAEVQRAYESRPPVLSLPPASRRRPTVVLLALAAAAALIVAWAMHRPLVTERPEVVRHDPRPAVKAPIVVARHDVEADETLILDIDGSRTTERREPAPAPAASDSLAMLDMPPHMPGDVLGLWESLSP